MRDNDPPTAVLFLSVGAGNPARLEETCRNLVMERAVLNE